MKRTACSPKMTGIQGYPMVQTRSVWRGAWEFLQKSSTPNRKGELGLRVSAVNREGGADGQRTRKSHKHQLDSALGTGGIHPLLTPSSPVLSLLAWSSGPEVCLLVMILFNRFISSKAYLHRAVLIRTTAQPYVPGTARFSHFVSDSSLVSIPFHSQMCSYLDDKLHYHPWLCPTRVENGLRSKSAEQNAS